MTPSTNILIAYYGDDFTGSTDALEILSKSGIRTALFIEPPTPEQLARYPDIRAFGIAGMTRAMTPEAMQKVLKPAFEALKDSGAGHVHYKVCSTFDSSAEVGSIGLAMDIGAEIFKPDFISLVVAAPNLGRYCVFGNLFARMGIGSQGQIHRLDRHPSMSKHPVTPSDESDLRLHLGKQTTKKCGLIDILDIDKPLSQIRETLKNKVNEGAEIVLFDAVYPEQMATIGELIDAYHDNEMPHFSVGSSGIEMALGNFWANTETIKPTISWPDPGIACPLLVVSGSCSPVTATQIEWAIQNGFEEVFLDTEAIASEGEYYSLINEIGAAANFIGDNKSVIIHTSKGAADARFARTSEILHNTGLSNSEIQTRTSRLYGNALGQIINAVLAKNPVKRIVIAGGDTSSFVARTIGIEAVEMIAPITPGAPLCRAHAPGYPIDGREVVFKGGQVGGEDYFGVILKGKL